MKAHRPIVFVVLCSALYTPVLAQHFEHRVNALISGSSIVFPVSEIPYLSVRMRALGAGFAGLVQDTLTDLFVHPAALFQISGDRVVVDYAPRPEPEILPFQRITGTGSDESGGELVAPAAAGGTLTRGPVLSLGYWSSRLFGKGLSAGVFFRGITDKQSSSLSDNLAFSNSGGQNNRESTSQKLAVSDEFSAQLWLGVLNRSNVQVAFSYRFYYLQRKSQNEFQLRETFSSSGSGLDREVKNFSSSGSGQPWRGHELALGARISAGKWDILPQLRWKYYRSRFWINNEVSMFERNVYSNPPNPFTNTSQFDHRTLGPGVYRLYAWEGGVEGWRGLTRLHLFARIARFKSREMQDDALQDVRKQTGSGSFNFRMEETSQQSANGSNTLVAFRGGVGQVIPVHRRARILAGLQLSYVRTKISAPLAFEDHQVTVRDSVTDQLDVMDEIPALDRTRETALNLPVALEGEVGPIQARLGVVWHWRDTDQHSRRLGDLPSRREIENRSSTRAIDREAMAGLGFRWKRFRLDAFLGSDLIQLDRWQVALSANL
ncbi:MAG: hypothetical protein D6715_07110 [Calditrichaeota bacterium]|nr:MAG: hypothetical protein D6715_07110 [Calditrichota bacterium]